MLALTYLKKSFVLKVEMNNFCCLMVIFEKKFILAQPWVI